VGGRKETEVVDSLARSVSDRGRRGCGKKSLATISMKKENPPPTRHQVTKIPLDSPIMNKKNKGG